MSASEKLKALEDVKAVDWPTPDHQTYRDNENTLRRRDIALARALPQVIAVVEAAENHYCGNHYAFVGGDDALADSLAALDEALDAKP